MPEITPSRFLVQASWDDVPHLDENTKRELLDSTPPYLREARSKGIPTMGAGAIYPIPWEHVSVDPFPIPPHWKRGYGLDVGWNNTAAKWLTQDPATGVFYFFAEYLAQKKTALIHSAAIKTRGDWMIGAIDPASRGRSQVDGKKLFDEYRGQGLNLSIAINAVDAGLDYLWSLYETGRLKHFKNLTETEREYRLYRRAKTVDKNEVTTVKVVKKDDHLMDADRYAVMTFDKIGQVRPANDRGHGDGFVAADQRSGY